MYDEFVARTTWGPGTAVQKWFIRRVLNTVLRVIQRPIGDLEVLEIGTGMGHFAEVAVAQGVKRYVGIEPNRMLRESAQQSAGKFEVLDGALPHLPSQTHGQFDFVILTHVLEHAQSGYEAREWADSLLSTLKPGGCVVVISPDVLDYKGFMWATDWSHAFPTSAENVRQIFADTGSTIKVAKRMRFGSLNPVTTSIAFLLSKLFPTKLANVVSRNLLGRELGTSVQVAFFWGLACVIAMKPVGELNKSAEN